MKLTAKLFVFPHMLNSGEQHMDVICQTNLKTAQLLSSSRAMDWVQLLFASMSLRQNPGVTLLLFMAFPSLDMRCLLVTYWQNLVTHRPGGHPASYRWC